MLRNAPLALLLATLLSSLAPAAHASSRPKDAILLSGVQTLTLRGSGAKTTHRRVAALPQLRCAGPRALCDLYEIDALRCTNQGSSYEDEDVEWSCKASLPEELKLGGTDVVCEGYSGPEDPYVLKGSCAVEYRLALTNVGEERYAHLAGGGRGAKGAGGKSWQAFSDGDGGTDFSAWIFTVIFLGVLGWILWSACIAAGGNRQPRQRRANTGRRGGGGGGGPGGGGDGGWNPGWGTDDYDEPPPPYPGSKKTASSGSARQSGWGPGFWGGAAGGAAAGYAASNWARGSRNNAGESSRHGAGSSSTPSSSSPPSFSSSRHESTGFGSTSRR